jgi:DNA-directed RNA polymerase specialized sigma54-like protein
MEVERDPLFQELLGAEKSGQRIIRYKRIGRHGISSQFYEMADNDIVGGSGVSPESLIDQKKQLLALVRKLGQDKFEKHFLYREEGVSIESIANQCGLSVSEAQQINDFILNMSVLSEFYFPSQLQSTQLMRPTLVGRIVRNDDTSYSIAFFSPHLARGTYEINHLALRSWQREKKLDRNEASRLRRYVGLLEMANLKQGAFTRVLDYLLLAQRKYFDTQDLSQLAPISLRQVARHIQFAPSTISRVFSAKSILLPWEKEVPLLYLMPGRRRVLLHILEKMLAGREKRSTDADLAREIQETTGVNVSRRTVTACRHVLASRDQATPKS